MNNSNTIDIGINDLRTAIDSVEDELRWPELVEEAEAFKAEIGNLTAAEGTAGDLDSLPDYERHIDQAIEAPTPTCCGSAATS